jgi:hypothetical protein
MRVTVQNISAKIISTDVGLLNPGDTKSLDMAPDAAYRAAEGLADLEASGYVTISVAEEDNKFDDLEPAAVGTASVADGTITAAKLAADAVETAAIKNLNVTSGKLAADSVIAGKIADGAVDAVGCFAAGVVDTAALGALAVTAAKINMSVSSEQTGTGSSQNVAHGLTGTPSVVLAILTDVPAGQAVISYGAHTGTNSVVTVTSGAKFKVLSII